MIRPRERALEAVGLLGTKRPSLQPSLCRAPNFLEREYKKNQRNKEGVPFAASNKTPDSQAQPPSLFPQQLLFRPIRSRAAASSSV